MAIIECDMSQKKEYLNDLLPEGLQLVRIIEANPEKSTKGNDVLETIVESCKTVAKKRFWFPLAQGKCWVFESLMDATGLYKKNSEGRYEVETDNLIGVEVSAFIVHEDDTYNKTNDGHEAKKKTSIIKRFVKKEEIEKNE